MGYKFKPCKAVAKRFKVTKTGKVKGHHGFTSHLMSARPANQRRRNRKPQLIAEGHARNLRRYLGLSKLKPNQIAHERALADKARAEAETPATTATAG